MLSPVLVRDVEAGKVDAYQAEIDMTLGLVPSNQAERRRNAIS
jgi:hypothetical protein